MSEQTKPTEERYSISPLKVGRLLRFAYGVLAATAFALYFPARHKMNVAATTVTLAHLLVGVLVLLPTLFYLRRARNGWRWLAGVSIGVTGFYLFLKAALGHSTANDNMARNAHIAIGFGATVWFVGKWLASHFRRRTPQTAALTATMLIGIVSIAVAAGTLDYPADAYYRDLTATNAQQADNPLFPAGTRLTSGSDPNNVTQTVANWKQQSPEYCGRNGCHAAQYNEWLHSAHSSASNDPFYMAIETDFHKREGEPAARYCVGCHAPEKTLAPLPLAASSTTNGVDCLSCHAAVTSAKSGNGRLAFALYETYPFAEAKSGIRRTLHDFLLNVRPMPHQNALHHTELHAQPELCAGCHRQSFSVAQNGYQFVRTADTFGEWQSGAVSGRTARTAALSPQAARTCQDCHFPKTNGHTAHFSPGANTVLAALNFDDEQRERIETFLKQERLTLDIFSLRRAKKRPGQPQEWIAPLEKPLTPEKLTSGEAVILEIVVTNQGIGHSFPSGYDDLRDAALEITLTDTQGKTLLQNSEHKYRSIPLDKDGNAIPHHELDKQVTLASKRTIAPGGSEVVRYAFTLPKSTQGTLHIQARLIYRHLNAEFARWAAGNVPELPTTVLAAAQSEIKLNDTRPALVPQGAERIAVALRFADYGNGLLLPAERPDLSGAQRAFAIAQSLAPDRAEPALGMGRVYLREPLLLNARAQFEQVLKRVPGDPAASAELGTVFLRQAEYTEAIRLLKPLAERFPNDTTLLFDLGTAYFRSGQFASAAQTFEGSLAADPDNSAAHFQLMLSYQRLRRGAEKRREEATGLYLAPDPLNAGRRNNYLSHHPNAYRAAQPIPIYEMKPSL